MSVHQHAGLRLGVVGVIMGLFGGLEVVIGITTGNPLILSDGFHNLSDGITPFLGSVAEALNRYSSRHMLSCSVPNVVALITIITVPLLIIVTTWREREELTELTTTHLVVTIVLAMIGAGVNFGSHLILEGRGHVNVRAVQLHLKADILISFAIAISAVLMLVVHWPGWVFIGVAVVLVMIVKEGLSDAREAWAALHFGQKHEPRHDLRESHRH